jgi:hypothetical protein
MFGRHDLADVYERVLAEIQVYAYRIISFYEITDGEEGQK